MQNQHGKIILEREYSSELISEGIIIHYILKHFSFFCNSSPTSSDSIPLLTHRCVPDSHRSFALGLQWIVIRLLGTIPGPILFGVLFDRTCVLWQSTCGREGACRSYDNFYMSRCVFVYVSFYLTVYL